ncbi:MAG: hypothetical protein ACLFSQ_08465 [Candidatus Zixiibacteriota bacterium]
MPVFRDIAIKIDPRRIIKRLGHRKGMEIGENLIEKIHENIRIAYSLIEPALAMQTIEILEKSKNKLVCEKDFVIGGEKIAEFMKNSQMITLYAATIGPELESYQAKQESGLDKLLLDIIGSEATEQIARWFNRNLKTEAKRMGFSLTKRRSPGYMDFELSIQKSLVKISGGDEIGIEVNQKHFLIPRKSTTGIIGWIEKGK